MRKKLVTGVFIITLAVAMATGCGSQEAESTQQSIGEIDTIIGEEELENEAAFLQEMLNELESEIEEEFREFPENVETLKQDIEDAYNDCREFVEEEIEGDKDALLELVDKSEEKSKKLLEEN